MSLASKNGYNYLLVTLGAPDVQTENLCFKDTKYLYEWAFNTFENRTVLDTTQTIGTIKVRLSSETDTLQLNAAEKVTLLLPKDIDTSSIQQVLNIPESVDAPIEKGDEIGTVQLKLNDEIIGETKVLASAAVSKNFIYGLWDSIQNVMSSIWAKIILVLVVVAVLFYIVVTILYNRKKKKSKRLSTKRPKRRR